MTQNTCVHPLHLGQSMNYIIHDCILVNVELKLITVYVITYLNLSDGNVTWNYWCESIFHLMAIISLFSLQLINGSSLKLVLEASLRTPYTPSVTTREGCLSFPSLCSVSDSGVKTQVHDAGYDAFMTGISFIVLAAAVSGAKIFYDAQIGTLLHRSHSLSFYLNRIKNTFAA